MTNDKQTLREALLARRANISIIENAELSARACKALLMLSEYGHARTVLCYISIKNELDTRGFIRQAIKEGKRICLPSVKGDSLIAVLYSPGSELVRGKFGTVEIASGDEMPPEEIDLAVVPGVGFDRLGGRIGYGKGYYDRFLKDVHCPKVGLAYSIQLVESALCAPHDVKMDLIVTDQGRIVCGESRKQEG